MLFLTPLLLWGLLAAAVPIAIHLINRRRHKTIQWAAMQFLLKATRESRGKKKLRHILILTCRALGHRRARLRRRAADRLRPHRLGRRLHRHRGAAAGPLGLDGDQTRRRPRLPPPDRHRKSPRRHGQTSVPRASCSSTAPAANPRKSPRPTSSPSFPPPPPPTPPRTSPPCSPAPPSFSTDTTGPLRNLARLRPAILQLASR